MKKLFTSGALVVMALLAKATIHTVSNAAYLPAQFSTIQAAHDAATAGDTILVQGTENSYGNLTVSKTISIFGNTSIIGEGPQIDQMTFTNGTMDNSVFESLRCIGITNNADPGNLNGIVLRRCSINAMGYNVTSQILLQYWVVEGCVFTGSGSNTYNINGNCNYGNFKYWTVRNTVFNGKVAAFSDSSFDHCIFLDPVGTNVIFNCTVYTSFTNCIFYGASPSEEYYSQYNEYFNNISYGGTTTVFPIQANPNDPPYNIGGGNLVNNDPDFVNVPLMTSYSDSFDFNLQNGSPAIGAGNDDENIGAHDSTGWFREDNEPTIPVVRSIVIPGGNTVPAQGSFQITVNSVSHP